MTYADLLKHPKWQEKRLRVLDGAGWKCTRCSNAERTLHAHHKIYLKGHKPWEYEDGLLECLCELCHDAAHAEKAELERLVALQPTARLSLLTDAVAAAIDRGTVDPALPPKVQAAFARLGRAVCGEDQTALIDGYNHLQDLIDEFRDFRRGPGGVAA